MQLKIVRAVPIKEFVIRFSVQTMETQGLKEAVTGEYDIAIDVQPYVTSEEVDGKVKMNINGDAILQELTNMVASLQYTQRVAQEFAITGLVGSKWVAITEEERKNEVPALSDQS